MRSGRWFRSSCLAAAVVVTAAACGGGSSGNHAAPTSAPSGTSSGTTSGAPKPGGTVTFGELAGVTSLDPIHIAGGGTAGGDEAGALYGYLMRLDTTTNQYVPYLAKGLTPNSDYSQWTLTLRPGMTFTDGTPFNAQAVIQNLTRDMNPANHATAAGILGFVQSMSAPDPETVLFKLKQPWAGFPFVLAYTPGLIAAPSYLAKVQAGDTQTTPIGAGPFKVSSFRPGEELTLARNDQFVLGPPYLNSLTFVLIPGGPATLQAFQTGQLQAALLHDPASVSQAKSQNIPAYSNMQNLGSIVLLNNRPTSPLKDPRLREAVAMAVNTRIYNERVNQGTGIPSNQLFPQGSQWYSSGDAGVPYDTTKAKQLVQQVKQQTGWNGNLKFMCGNEPSNAAVPVALESMLQPIGINLQVTNDIPTATVITNVVVKKNFDMACWGYNVSDGAPFPNLWLQLDSQSPNNFAGFSSPVMDSALDALRVAATQQDQKAAIAKVVAAWNSGNPSVNLETVTELTIHKANLHGIEPTVATMALFDKAWVS